MKPIVHKGRMSWSWHDHKNFPATCDHVLHFIGCTIAQLWVFPEPCKPTLSVNMYKGANTYLTRSCEQN